MFSFLNYKGITISLLIMRFSTDMSFFLVFFVLVVFITCFNLFRRPSKFLSEEFVFALEDLSEWISFIDYYGMLEYLGEIEDEEIIDEFEKVV